jgi:hypothetical protein
MTKLFAPPPKFELPLSTGGDIYFGIIHKPLVVDGDGEPVLDPQGQKIYQVADFPDGATIQVIIETPDPTIIDGDIDGAIAVIWSQSEVADTIKAGTVWRAIITYSDGLDKVLCNGKTSRFDG